MCQVAGGRGFGSLRQTTGRHLLQQMAVLRQQQFERENSFSRTVLQAEIVDDHIYRVLRGTYNK